MFYSELSPLVSARGDNLLFLRWILTQMLAPLGCRPSFFGADMKTISIVAFLSIITLQIADSCTTAVVSGKATVDGRPLLLKNRDADDLQNKLVTFLDGKYRFVGLVNGRDRENKEVWSGYNNAGFAIMNSAAYNLKGDDTTKLADREGLIMKHALEVCASLADFESLLVSLPKPLGVEANFGVVDAFGGAAYFEVNNFHYTKFDANDPAVAPNGYLIRTNYSCAGEENKGFGYIRYATAEKLFADEFGSKKLSSGFLINDVPRCLVHSFTKEDLGKSLPKNSTDTTYAFFRDYIPRYYSSAATVVQGVRPSESTTLMTMWTVLGFPLTSVIVPVWLLEDGMLPSIMTADSTGNAPLCTAALELKERVFPVQNDAKENYINVAALMNRAQTGIRQRLQPVEKKILDRANRSLAGWRTRALNDTEARKFYEWVDAELIKEMKSAASVR
jgi:hypothetical protein